MPKKKEKYPEGLQEQIDALEHNSEQLLNMELKLKGKDLRAILSEICLSIRDSVIENYKYADGITRKINKILPHEYEDKDRLYG